MVPHISVNQILNFTENQPMTITQISNIINNLANEIMTFGPYLVSMY
jgi:hypothetical protein